MSSILATIKERRSIYPGRYTDTPISTAEVEMLLEVATWAPNHKKTEPWRFIVFHSEAARQSLADYLGTTYEARFTEDRYSEIKHKKMMKKPLQAGCVIAIILQRDRDERLPEWEEVAAVSCAVQNMWLTAWEMGIGAYWSSPSLITLGSKEFLDLDDGQRCLGLFYMGKWEPEVLPAQRKPISEVATWR